MQRRVLARRSFAALLLGAALIAFASAAEVACGGDPVGGDCTIKVTCLASDCKTTVRENACICPEGSKTADQCATPSIDASAPKDGSAADGASDGSTQDGGADGATDAASDGSSDAAANPD